LVYAFICQQILGHFHLLVIGITEILLDAYSEAELLNHTVILCLLFARTSTIFHGGCTSNEQVLCFSTFSLLWFGYGLSVSLKDLFVGSLVLSVVMLEVVEPLESRAEWQFIRLLGALPQKRLWYFS
jgi:hypothetical protein